LVGSDWWIGGVFHARFGSGEWIEGGVHVWIKLFWRDIIRIKKITCWLWAFWSLRREKEKETVDVGDGDDIWILWVYAIWERVWCIQYRDDRERERGVTFNCYCNFQVFDYFWEKIRGNFEWKLPFR
jgi:hypothetical protein